MSIKSLGKEPEQPFLLIAYKKRQNAFECLVPSLLRCSTATAVLKCQPLTTSRVPAWRDKCGIHKTILSDGIFTALPEAIEKIKILSDQNYLCINAFIMTGRNG